MKAVLTRFHRPRFADATSVLALFVALGGTGYAAASLPGNSVSSHQIRASAVGKSEARTGAIGKAEIRTGAVGKAEIAVDGVGAAEVRRNAIDTTELRDDGIDLADLAPAARTALTEASAVSFRTAVTSAGAAAGGNAKAASRTGPGEYLVDLGRDVSACQFAATLAGVKSGTAVEPPKPGFIVATPSATATMANVSIKDPASAPRATTRSGARAACAVAETPSVSTNAPDAARAAVAARSSGRRGPPPIRSTQTSKNPSVDRHYARQGAKASVSQ